MPKSFYTDILWNKKTNLCTKLEPPMTSLQNDFIFRKYGHGVTIMTSSTHVPFSKYFGEHQPTSYQIWYFYDFWFKSLIGTASCLSGNAFASGTGGLRFKSRVSQIGHSVAIGSPPLRHFFEMSCVAQT